VSYRASKAFILYDASTRICAKWLCDWYHRTIIKDKSGNLSSVENHRPITLSYVISKVFESVLVIKCGEFLNVNDRQLGFKNIGRNNAIFVLHNVIEYFNERGSNVYLASLNVTKAFDHVNHFQLYQTLMKHNVPITFLSIIINWYGKMTVMLGEILHSQAY